MSADRSTALTPPLLQRRQLLRWMTGGLAASSAPLLVACGGGGHGDGGGAGTPTDAGGGTPGPSTGGAPSTPAPGTPTEPTPPNSPTTLSDADRYATFALVSAKDRELQQGRSTRDYLAALAAYMATLPAYKETGFDPETLCAWGRFVDGRAHLIIANRVVLPQQRTAAAMAGGIKRALAAPIEMPALSTARVMHSFGTDFAGQGTVDLLSGWLGAAGYAVRPGVEGDAHLTTLRGIKGDGFLYINTHGGRWGRVERSIELPWIGKLQNDSPSFYAITSSTHASAAMDANPATRDDLDNWRLVYTDADLGERGPGGETIKSKVYGITAGFVDKYWQFPAHSIVVVNACSSARTETYWAADFLFAVQKAGAGAYLGWTETVSSIGADRAPRYFVDRLLGANQWDRERPDQRPFQIDSVLQDMKAGGEDVDPEVGARFVFKPRPGDASIGILAPTIHDLQVSEYLDTLTLNGGFGSEEGRVEVDGAQLTNLSWTPNRIVCKLPRSGAGSAGSVIVRVRTLRSNVRQITQWLIPLTCTFNDGFIAVSGSGRVRVRADIGGRRNEAGQTPEVPMAYAIGTRDSTLDLSATGDWIGPLDCAHRVRGEARYLGIPELPSDPTQAPALPITSFNTYFKADPVSGRGALALAIGDLRGGSFTDTSCNGVSRVARVLGTLDGRETFMVPGDGSTAPVALQLSALRFTLGGDYALPARTFLDAENAGMVLTWPRVTPSFPPLPGNAI